MRLYYHKAKKMQETSSKLEENNLMDNEKTQEKRSNLSGKLQKTLPRGSETNNGTNISTPPKETERTESKFKTPEKIDHHTSENLSVNLNENKKLEKYAENFDLTIEQISCDGEDGMISTAEQARLLIAVNKTPSKSMNKTPNKQHTPNEKRSVENSPVTPGKYKRVELITLASPKAKRIKQI